MISDSKRFGSAAVLAGGKSSRMGGIDKQFLKYKGETLGRRAARILRERFDEVIIVTRAPEHYENLDVRCVEDKIPGKGPLSGIHAALSTAESEWLYLMACDMPEFSLEYAHLLQRTTSILLDEKRKGNAVPRACISRFGSHIEPFHALYSRVLIGEIEKMVTGSSVRDLLESGPCVYIDEAETRLYSPDWSLFFNVNSPEDLARLEFLEHQLTRR